VMNRLKKIGETIGSKISMEKDRQGDTKVTEEAVGGD